MKFHIKIAVAANSDGEFLASGFTSAESWEEAMDAFEQLDHEHRFWVEAELEIADQPPTIEGKVKAAP